MCMINNTILTICSKLLYLMVHQMRRQLTCWSSAIYKSPYDTVIFTLIIYLDHADGIFWFNDNIAEILAASCYKEIFSCQIRNASTDWLPLFCFKVFLNGLYLFRLYTIRKVSAVSLMPALLPAVVCHTNESLNKFCI